MFGGLHRVSVMLNRVGGYFEYDCVSCGDGVEDRTEGAPDGEVPWTHDKDYTEWFLSNSTFIELERHRNRDVFILGPLIDLPC